MALGSNVETMIVVYGQTTGLGYGHRVVSSGVLRRLFEMRYS